MAIGTVFKKGILLISGHDLSLDRVEKQREGRKRRGKGDQ